MTEGGSPWIAVIKHIDQELVNDSFIKKNDYNNSLSPLSGSEPKYEPEKWNSLDENLQNTCTKKKDVKKNTDQIFLF